MEDGVPGRDVIGSSLERELKWGSDKNLGEGSKLVP